MAWWCYVKNKKSYFVLIRAAIRIRLRAFTWLSYLCRSRYILACCRGHLGFWSLKNKALWVLQQKITHPQWTWKFSLFPTMLQKVFYSLHPHQSHHQMIQMSLNWQLACLSQLEYLEYHFWQIDFLEEQQLLLRVSETKKSKPWEEHQ